MYVEEIIALARLSQDEGTIVSDLAQAVLDLIEQLRDVSLRADLAEATLEVEQKRIGDIRRRIAGFRGADAETQKDLLRQLAEVALR